MKLPARKGRLEFSLPNVAGLMPHPERFLDATQHPAWNGRFDGRAAGAGLTLFVNAVKAVS